MRVYEQLCFILGTDAQVEVFLHRPLHGREGDGISQEVEHLDLPGDVAGLGHVCVQVREGLGLGGTQDVKKKLPRRRNAQHIMVPGGFGLSWEQVLQRVMDRIFDVLGNSCLLGAVWSIVS